MRVVFVVWPAAAHLYPMVPLAWSLQCAGHEVCVASHPNLAPYTKSVGLTPVSLGGDDLPPPTGPAGAYPAEREMMAGMTDELLGELDDREPWDTVTQFLLPAAWDFNPYQAPPSQPLPVMDDLAEFTRNWRPDLVLWDPCMPGAAVAAKACGAAHARHLYGQDYQAWLGDRLAAHTDRTGVELENLLAGTIRPMAERYHVDVDDELLFGAWTIDPMPVPTRLHTTTNTVGMRWIPYSWQTPLPSWLKSRAERPRVALTLGVSQREFLKGGWDYVPTLLDAASGIDIEMVATLNATQLVDVSQVPGNVRTVDYVPLNQLLPTCSAIIHHGSSGTLAASCTAGLPQLITDHPQVVAEAVTDDEGGMGATKHTSSIVGARYITSRGAGAIVDIANPSAEVIRKQILDVLAKPSFRIGAARVRDDYLAMPSPSEIVPTLERLTAAHR
ncbi:glycosyltransferase [Amycolatopsis marina]|uniref:Glycosyltransferase n=1 Tax=Amycolatopsis marina TaxID=490629 RepID=A0A1I0ZJE7_9PSEU|nr:nucleotide disphospho-sugar-binding domain-containing protein [Amycolatopsis marina]SFB25774.1 glycosyltransferase [Amycolatopsis marina]